MFPKLTFEFFLAHSSRTLRLFRMGKFHRKQFDHGPRRGICGMYAWVSSRLSLSCLIYLLDCTTKADVIIIMWLALNLKQRNERVGEYMKVKVKARWGTPFFKGWGGGALHFIRTFPGFARSSGRSSIEIKTWEVMTWNKDHRFFILLVNVKVNNLVFRTRGLILVNLITLGWVRSVQ